MTAPLRDLLLEVFARGVGRPLSDDEFNTFAAQVFQYQCEGSSAYRGYCVARGVQPREGLTWEQIPPVPTRAFKVMEFNAHPEQRIEATFRTSGTTRGATGRGTHVVADLSLYRASLLPNFAARLLPEGEMLPMLALAVPPSDQGYSSLSFMLGVVADELVSPDGYFVSEDRGLDVEGLEGVLRRRCEEGEPVLIAGTAFTLVHWLDALSARGVRLRLPEGSRIMETGGFKGRSREVERPELYAALTDRLNVPNDHIVNEYGMTELLSQYYEPVLTGGPRRHVPPPWMRTRVLDPQTLESLPLGQAGLIQHFDLANLNSVSAVLTEDLGVLTDEGLELLGRAGGAEPRGCSIAMDALLSAVQSG